MCGIVGYTGTRDAQEIILDCLKRLEYRGYDSSGVAIISRNELVLRKSVGEIAVLESKIEKIPGTTGIAHTRWATHGKPTTQNAHPFVDCKSEYAVVHNGILTNYMELKDALAKEGHIFSSETDSEVFAHLIEIAPGTDAMSKLRHVLKKVEGAYAIAVV